MSALTVVETDLDCEGGIEEIDVRSKSVFHFHFTITKKSRKIESNRIQESNRIATLDGTKLFVRARWMTTRRVPSTPPTTPTPTRARMDDKDISLHPSRAFHPSKSIRASVYASGVRRANEIRRSAYLQFASTIIQPNATPTTRADGDAMRTNTKKRNETNLFRSTTYLNLGRLEGGDAADEGGSEKRGHYLVLQ
jgi:hypothetical protein